MSGPVRARVEYTRAAPRRGWDRLRSRWLLVVQMAVSAGLAWQLASLVLDRPFFAPVSAVIALGAGGGHVRRALEIAVGVAVGILVADLLIHLIGSGGLAIALVVGLSTATALLLGAGQLLVNQAAVSAVLLAALGSPSGGLFDRFFSALIGGAVAVVIGPVLFARDPMKVVGEEADRVLARLAEALDAVADALGTGDAEAAARALQLARQADAETGDFEEALAAADESIRLTPPRRRNLPRLAVYADAAAQVDYALRNTRVLARAAETATVRGVPADPSLVDAIHHLADAVRALGDGLRHPEHDSGARDLARQAAREATAVLDRRQDLSANVIVSQIRSTAADILRGSGMDTQEMRTTLGPYPGSAEPAPPNGPGSAESEW